MTTTTVPKYTKTDWIKLLFCFIIPVIFLLLPENAIMTGPTKWFLAATVWLLMWAAFELTNLLFPSLMYPVILILSGVLDVQMAYISWANLIVPTVVAALVIGNALDECGFLRRICFWIVKTCGGSFNRTMIALFFAGLAMTFATFACASIILATIGYGFCKSLDLRHSKEAAIVMMVGMVAGSTCRMFVYYPLMMGALLGSTASVAPDFTITVIDLLKYNWPVAVYSLLFIGWMLWDNRKTQSDIAHKGADYFKEQYETLGKMSITEKKAAVLMVLLMVLVVFAPTLKIDTMIPFIIVVSLFYFPGIDIGTGQSIRAVPFGTVFFIGSCMAIGVGCNAVGLTEHLSVLLTTMLGDMNIVLLLLVILAFGAIANFAMTPLAMLAAFSGPLLAVATSLGINPEAVLYTFYFATDMVFLPYEYVTFLIFFSFGMMTTGQFVKYHTVKNILFVAFLVVVMIPYWYLVGLL